MKKLFDFFSLSRSERNGFLVLFFLILLSTLIPMILSLSSKDEALTIDYQQLDERLTTTIQKDTATNIHPRSNALAKKPIAYFKFDPNHLSYEEWTEIGFRPHQIRMIHNYLSKGGKFKTKEDLKKIYSISAADYDRVAAYIEIKPADREDAGQDQHPSSSVIREPRAIQIPLKVDINAADTSMWKDLRGIGSVFASRIVRFRDALGGFHNVNQLREVYGMDDERFKTIVPYLEIGQLSLARIDVNSAGIDILRKHPYINNKQAIAIVNNREQNGPFKNIEDLKRIVILDTVFLNKLAPYLAF